MNNQTWSSKRKLQVWSENGRWKLKIVLYNNPTRFRSYAVKFNFYFAFISIKYGYMSFLWVQSLGWFASKSSKTMVWWILPNRSSVALKKSNLDLYCNLLNSFCMYVVYNLNCSSKKYFSFNWFRNSLQPPQFCGWW